MKIQAVLVLVYLIKHGFRPSLGFRLIVTIAQKEFNDQNDCMETVRSAIAIAISISAIVAISIIAMPRSLSARFPYNRSDR